VRSNRLSIVVGGEAGQGVESNGAGFAKAFTRSGLYVYAYPDFMSRIRGGYNFYQVRTSDEPIYSHTNEINLLMAFNEESVAVHRDQITPGGGIIYDQGLKIDANDLTQRGLKAFSAPLIKIAEEHGSRIMMNMAALGVAGGLVEFPFEHMAAVIQQNFKRKGTQVVDANLRVARTAYDYALNNWAADFAWKLPGLPDQPTRILPNGNQAIGMGAIAGGCRFISGYPMTPATSVLEYLTSQANRYGIVSKQMEDEISACLMAIGASHAGARSMTSTSGGGFCLMVEALGLAGCAETPLVIVLAQRGGPSTGLPTRTEQPDLEFAIHASHGEFPRIILAPGTVEQCFEAGWRAFNLAEKYQCPVIVMTDLFQAFAIRSVELDAIDFSSVTIDRGELLSNEDIEALPNGFARYKVTESGISPRAVPGHPKTVYVAVGDEHTEEGRITEDVDIRIAQMDKRMRKLETAVEEMRAPEQYGADDAEITLACWGSLYGSVREAVDQLNEDGIKANMLHFVDMWPFPEAKVTPLVERARRLIVVEQNYTGQLANLIRLHTGRKADHKMNKYDGRQITAAEIVAKVKAEVTVHV
jgi:2-oxoglutarate/2-oxoacid ferredoxin oxidoreductase subunit alpha